MYDWLLSFDHHFMIIFNRSNLHIIIWGNVFVETFLRTSDEDQRNATETSTEWFPLFLEESRKAEVLSNEWRWQREQENDTSDRDL